ncbi:MAG TPA: nucleoside 2-deoxyribosyltransferase [Candidatus Saccharimonadales bacterium]|nr:nucleoside 2-deoxyribosyltransferase [Candidatus Saccharimonadales bacterium]
MIVHFVAPTPQFEKNQASYQKIIDAIIASGYEPSSEFSQRVPTEIEMGLSMLDQEDWETICRRELARIDACDALIADATNKSTFGVGYEVAIALAQEKPVLLLLRDGSMGGSFISGLMHPLLTRQQFNDAAIKRVVRDFCLTIRKEK